MTNEMLMFLNEQYKNKEITFEQWNEGIKSIAMVANNSTNSGTNSGTKSIKKFSVDLKDYEPKKDKDGFYNFASYKACQKKFCYAVATNGLSNCYTKSVDINFDGAYAKAKAEFKKAYVYTKLADR